MGGCVGGRVSGWADGQAQKYAKYHVSLILDCCKGVKKVSKNYEKSVFVEVGLVQRYQKSVKKCIL